MWLIAGITIKECLRNRALQGIMAIALLLCLVFLTIIPMFAFDTGKVAVDFGFSSMTLAGLTIVIFLGISLLARDLHERTVTMILARPVSRKEYVIGKYLGLSFSVFVAVTSIALLSTAIIWLGIKFSIVMVEPRNFSFLVLITAIGFQFLSLLLLLVIAFFLTCLTTSEYLTMLFTVCVYIIGNSLETIIEVVKSGEFVNVGKSYLTLLELLAWIFPNFNAFDLKVYLAYGIPLPIGQLFWVFLYGLFYIAVVGFFTLWIFERKEIC